jgi:hypothetical protein
MQNVKCRMQKVRSRLESFCTLHSSFFIGKWGRHGFAHLAVRQHFSPGKSRGFTAKVCSPKAFCGMEILSNYYWRCDQTDSRVQRLGLHQPGAFNADNEHASNR